ncbi:serine/threonine-protein phosphatase [Solihabitans fulvus]|uniref:Serine/threonine-protein phosphatase n=1 Tax=Solihabitans fulvus TaxID=1892852 RepID=A0A5B2XWG7_9PSEU|nr:protein phosphatase 2C domain-containing protein [Solihabitans fulvus]KAA2267034.1 serine/threonine-protein phosphatase [Solihabitans fulvus]
MTHDTELGLRYAVGTDLGLHREVNEDSAYASPRLLAVADGMGGHAHGEVASSIAVAAMAKLDDRLAATDRQGVDPLAALAGAVSAIARRLAEVADQEPQLRGMGTTLTALLPFGPGFAVAHLGDSRGYLLRGGELRQLTHDHTLVQALVDDGQLPREQAAQHPRRSMLMKALQSTGSGEPDLFLHQAATGDRYLLCSDGLTDVTPDEDVRGALAEAADPDAAVRQLIELANRAGGPDNITCVVVDVRDRPSGRGGRRIVRGAAEGTVDVRTSRLPGWLRRLLAQA